MQLNPGSVSFAEWREVYQGGPVRLSPDCRPAIAESAASVERILARGEAVYGINTGFGKLAAVRIESADLETLQRNIVLSHAAGIGAPTPAAWLGTILRWSVSRSALSMRTAASFPKPVLIP